MRSKAGWKHLPLSCAHRAATGEVTRSTFRPTLYLMSSRQITFTDLYLAVRDTPRSDEKIALLAQYLEATPDEEFCWAVYLLRGGSFRGVVKTRELREWAGEVAGVPGWLVEESYAVAGDLAETVSLLVAATPREAPIGATSHTLVRWIKQIEQIQRADATYRKEVVLTLWRAMTQPEILVFTKLITGGLRIGVSKGLVVRALATLFTIPDAEVWRRLAGNKRPEDLTRQILCQSVDTSQSTAPYPFFLAYPLESDTLEDLPFHGWRVEYKWDGIRAQVVKRGGQVAIWSRGDELVTEIFPELHEEASAALPDGVVLDGEIVAWSSGDHEADHPADFSVLQQRLNRSKVSAALRRRAPVRFLAYDILEYGGVDIRSRPLRERIRYLEEVLAAHLATSLSFAMPESLVCTSWEEARLIQTGARKHHAEGLMLKHHESPYGVGRTARGAWWKWKVQPLSIDAVLLYAQKGRGRRADLFTDYTFGVWDGDTLVPFAKAYSGLTDSEIMKVDAFIKRHTKERFGPVRTVQPELVFEIAFEAIWPSKRHRSGVAVRFPRIVRWRLDKPAREADTLETLQGFLAGEKR